MPVIGILYLVLASPRLLREREGVRSIEERERRALMELELDQDADLVGQTVAEAGLEKLPGLTLARIDRGERAIAPVEPDAPGQRGRERLAHSLGMREGAIGIVNAFGHRDYRGRNRVVIAHEFLHLVGATDKYDPDTGRPIHPHGFARPDREPRFPQARAEIMGASIPVGGGEIVMPASLDETVVGPATAREIGWTQ